jgi:hypothetical protein
VVGVFALNVLRVIFVEQTMKFNPHDKLPKKKWRKRQLKKWLSCQPWRYDIEKDMFVNSKWRISEETVWRNRLKGKWATFPNMLWITTPTRESSVIMDLFLNIGDNYCWKDSNPVEE